jgi:hypothetical protein
LKTLNWANPAYETDTVFLDSIEENGFELRFNQSMSLNSSVAFTMTKYAGQYLANDQKEKDFVLYEYSPFQNQLEKNQAVPLEIIRPKGNKPIFFNCARIQSSFDKSKQTDPLCQVEDFGEPYLMLR